MEDGEYKVGTEGKKEGMEEGEGERWRERLQMNYCHPKIDTLGILIFYSL